MTLGQWLLDLDISVAKVRVVVEIGPAQSSCFHRNLHFLDFWGADRFGNLMRRIAAVSIRIKCDLDNSLHEPDANLSGRREPEPECCQVVALGCSPSCDT